MKTIWRISLTPTLDEQIFELPGFSNVAFIGSKNGFANQVDVWCHVRTNQQKKAVTFLVTGTGKQSPFSVDYDYLGSAICDVYVWHVWQKKTEPKLIEV